MIPPTVDPHLLGGFRGWTTAELKAAERILRVSEEPISASLGTIRSKLAAVEIALAERNGEELKGEAGQLITEFDYWAVWVCSTIEFLRKGNPQVAAKFEDAMVEHLRIWRIAIAAGEEAGS